jgi:hypothetical protein
MNPENTPREDKILTFLDLFEEAFKEQQQQLRRYIELEMKQLKDELKDRTDFQQVVEPVIDQKVIKIKAEIDNLSGELIVRNIKQQIRESQPEMIDALYPIIGKLIKKYVQTELENITENINQQIDNTFSWQSMRREFLSLFGIKEKELLLKDALSPQIVEAYIIFQESGLLLGQYSRQDVLDRDLVAAMLTAIKAFMRDAFAEGTVGDLDMIEYGQQKVMVLNFHRYYLVAVSAGIVDSAFKEKVLDYLRLFNETHLALLDDAQLQSQDFSPLFEQHWQNFHKFNPIIHKTNEFTKHIKQKSNLDWKFWRW